MALRLALDTNRYTDLCRGHARVVETIAAAEEIWLPFTVLAELRAGFAVGSQGTPPITMPPYKEAGTPIPTNDIWIAALVIQHSLVLFARDSHFNALPQIACA